MRWRGLAHDWAPAIEDVITAFGLDPKGRLEQRAQIIAELLGTALSYSIRGPSFDPKPNSIPNEGLFREKTWNFWA